MPRLRIILLLCLGAVLLVAMSIDSSSPVREDFGELSEEARNNLANRKIFTPPPWRELSRLPSPDGLVEAVLVERGVGEDHIGTRGPTNLYIVPRGGKIDPEPPIHPGGTWQHIENLKQAAPFVGFEVDEVAIKWKGLDTVCLNARQAGIQGKASTAKVVLGDKTRLVHLEYNVQSVLYDTSGTQEARPSGGRGAPAHFCQKCEGAPQLTG